MKILSALVSAILVLLTRSATPQTVELWPPNESFELLRIHETAKIFAQLCADYDKPWSTPNLPR